MSKLRRSNSCSTYRNNKAKGDGIHDIKNNNRVKINGGKIMSHGEFLNRIKKSLYYGKAKMSIPLSDYIADAFSETHNGYSLNRLNYSTVGQLRSTPCSLILAMIYLERLKDSDPAYTKHVTPTELFLVSMMVATKFYSGHDDDSPHVNWAECLNTTPDNLLQMELSFLNAINWRVYVSNEEFFENVLSVEAILAQQQGTKRGFFTYIELSSAMPPIQIAKQLLHDFLIVSLSYTVFVASMIVSVMIVSQIPYTCLNTPSRTCRTQLPPDNSDSHQIIGTKDIMHIPEIKFIEFKEIESNLNMTHVMITKTQPNLSNNLFLSSWYSFLKIDSLEWPVITKDLEIIYYQYRKMLNA